MTKGTKLNILGQLCLLSATLVWGSSFVLLKETLVGTPPMYVISIRFLSSAILIAFIFVKKMITMDKKTFMQGLFLGVILSFAYITQTYGLTMTTPGQNAFLTSTYCVMCPFFIWILFKEKPKSYNVIAAVLALIGIGFVAFSNGDGYGSNIFLGNGLTLLAAMFFGFQIIFISRFQAKGSDAVRLVTVELGSAGVFLAIVTVLFELPAYGGDAYILNADQIWKIVYLTFVCTAYAQLIQNVGLKYTKSEQSAVILSLESVFGTVFSIISGYEQVTVLLFVGFGIIFVSMLISELGIDVCKPFRMFFYKNL